jgi:CHASE2 domain-containing sensor protein
MPRPLRPAAARRLAIQALAVCVVALAAAVVAFVQGSWSGVIWLMLAALTSNLAWYYHRRGRGPRTEDPASPAAAGDDA